MTEEHSPVASAAPPIGGILETAVYVEDLARASAFYERLLGIAPMLKQERLHAFPVAPKEVLLLFPRALSKDDSVTSFGIVPGHATTGPSHFAFRIAQADYERWRAWLGKLDIAVTGEVHWPQGGSSLYFDDPDGNVIEVATPGLWANYRAEAGQ